MPDTRSVTLRKPKLKDDALYLGDNGICLCGAHSGMTAYYTGRDLSGQPLLYLTRALITGNGFSVDAYACERCGIGVRE